MSEEENTNLHTSLVDAHHARMRALLDGDVDALGRVVGEDLTFVSSFGKIQTRPEVFEAFKRGTLRIERMETFDITTRIYGDIGILLYAADTKMIDGDVTVEGKTRSTTVYAMRDGGWQLVAQHQSRIE